MDERLRTIRECAEYLAGEVAGDREIGCLAASVRASLELIAEMLGAHDAPPARGYKDACDKMCAYGVCDADLAERLKEVFDIAERAPTAWSSLKPGDLAKAREQGARALTELADLFERIGSQATAPVSS